MAPEGSGPRNVWTFRGSKMHGSKTAYEAAAAMAKPGMNRSDMSRIPPTSIGDTNIARLEKVSSEPNYRYPCRPSAWAGWAILDTYTQEPMPW